MCLFIMISMYISIYKFLPIAKHFVTHTYRVDGGTHTQTHKFFFSLKTRMESNIKFIKTEGRMSRG